MNALIDALGLPLVARPRAGGDSVGVLRSLGRRLVVFPLRLCAVPAAQVLSPGLYEREADGRWSSGAAVAFPLTDVTAGGPQLAPLSVGYVQDVSGFQDFGWLPAVGDPVVWLGTLDARALEAVGVPFRRPLAFMADGHVTHIDAGAWDFGTGATTVGGASAGVPQGQPVSGRVLVRQMGEVCCAAFDTRGVLTVAGNPDDAARECIALGARDVWLDLGPKLRRLRRQRGLHG